MKRKARLVEILNLIETQKEINVNYLAQQFQTSRETIRRDLTVLEQQGVLTRNYGGATYNSAQGKVDTISEYPISVRNIRQVEEKKALCKFAASRICDGDVVFVDNSSTTSYLLDYVPKEYHITFVTNSFNLLLSACEKKETNFSFVCLGGSFNPSRTSNLSFTGAMTLKNAEEYYPSKAFLSCAAVRSDGVLTDIGSYETDTKRLMIKNSQQTFFLIDHTKFQSSGQVFITNVLPQFSFIIDNQLRPEDSAFIRLYMNNVTLVEV